MRCTREEEENRKREISMNEILEINMYTPKAGDCLFGLFREGIQRTSTLQFTLRSGTYTKITNFLAITK